MDLLIWFFFCKILRSMAGPGQHSYSDLHTAHVAMRTCVDYPHPDISPAVWVATAAGHLGSSTLSPTRAPSSWGTSSDSILWILRVYRCSLFNYTLQIDISIILSAPVKLVL